VDEPQLGSAALTTQRPFRDVEQLGDFAIRQADKELQLDDSRLPGIERRQVRQRVVECEQLFRLTISAQRLGVDWLAAFRHEGIERHVDALAAAFAGAALSRMVDEDLAHRSRGVGEKVGPILPARSRLPEEAHVGLVDERGRLERVAGSFLAHIAARQAAELGVHQLEQLRLGGGVSGRDCAQKPSDMSRCLAHRCIPNRTEGEPRRTLILQPADGSARRNGEFGVPARHAAMGLCHLVRRLRGNAGPCPHRSGTCALHITSTTSHWIRNDAQPRGHRFTVGADLETVMTAHDRATIAFRRLTEVDPASIIDLMNHPLVRRHLPLARGRFGPTECARFIASKEAMWEEHGYGPWAFMIGGEFAGWGGIQCEGGEADIGLVLHPKHWGAGKVLYHRIVDFAFGDRGFSSVIALLPPSRTRVTGVLKLGFRADGELVIAGERFIRYRLNAPAMGSDPHRG
jgi:ribosomal-protein-alanine N-acetyltransferase